MKISLTANDPTTIKCDVLAVDVFEGTVKPSGALGALDKKLEGIISKLIASKEISGKSGTSSLIHTYGKLLCDHVLVLGMGKREEFNVDEARKAMSAAVGAAKKLKAKKLAAVIPGSGIREIKTSDACKALVEGAFIGDYEFNIYKTEDNESGQLDELIISDAKKSKDLDRICEETSIICNLVNKARDMINEPSNKMTPSLFSRTAKSISEEAGINCQVLGREEIQKLKMGAFLSVAKGSCEEPKLVVLKYMKGKNSRDVLGLIGKGVTFDSGGISLKPSKNMHEMKTDMAGAAAVLCSVVAAARLKVKKNVIAVIPLTENMPSGNASKPGDIVESMSGKTIEIITTDAEGRMILADAVTYAKKLGATKLLDVATLTGACVVALGDIASGILGTDQRFVEEVISAGNVSGEKLWQLPIYKEYREYLKSAVADMKNASDLGKAGTSSGATFIKEFTGDTPWVHIDVAGTADLDRDVPPYSKGATGAGTFTIVNYLLNS